MKPGFKTFIIAALTMFFNGPALFAQNILSLQDWQVGQGTAGIFVQNGQTSENIREWGEGPHGKRVILWKAVPEGNAHDDGGWNSNPFSINHTNMYRFTVWLKKTNSMTGNSYFGCSNVSHLNGTLNDNPYFWAGHLPELDKWYLLVGYIHGSGDASTVNYGGIYDGLSGAKVVDITDYKFATGATYSYHRTYLFYDPNINDRQYFYAPRVDVVNGDEPTIMALLGLQNASSDQTYFSGKVGIKIQNPGEYDLAVNGKVRTREVKVENSTWPDYVFATDYKMPSLTETEKHIKEKGHLPGIPSAAQVKSNGIELGEMNAKLLQKIEELTLHLIVLNKKLSIQNKKLTNQNLMIQKLKKNKR